MILFLCIEKKIKTQIKTKYSIQIELFEFKNNMNKIIFYKFQLNT